VFEKVKQARDLKTERKKKFISIKGSQNQKMTGAEKKNKKCSIVHSATSRYFESLDTTKPYY
jgi:hypothetical protein